MEIRMGELERSNLLGNLLPYIDELCKKYNYIYTICYNKHTFPDGTSLPVKEGIVHFIILKKQNSLLWFRINSMGVVEKNHIFITNVCKKEDGKKYNNANYFESDVLTIIKESDEFFEFIEQLENYCKEKYNVTV